MAITSISADIFNQRLRLSISSKRLNKINRFTVFNYHQVGEKFDASRYSANTFTTLKHFEKQIRYINKNFKMISLHDAIQLANNDELIGDYACITFDDGDKSIINAMELLEKYNTPATFFINSAYLGNKEAYWFNIYNFIKHSDQHQHLLNDAIHQDFLSLRKTLDPAEYQSGIKSIENLFPYIRDEFDMYVSFECLKTINHNLFDIGSHGREHQRYSMMSKEWQYDNTLKDVELLSSLPSFKPLFAIPFGRPHDWNFDTIDVLRELELEFVYADGGTNVGKSVGYQRIPSDGRKVKKLISSVPLG